MRFREVSNSRITSTSETRSSPAREAVEQLGGLGVAQRAEFLDLAQSDGEDVVEDRLVDVRQQDLEHVLALAGAVGGGQHELLAGRRWPPALVVAVDLEAAVGAGHFDPAAGPARRAAGGKYRRRSGEKP